MLMFSFSPCTEAYCCPSISMGAKLLESDAVPNAAVIVTSIADSDGNPVVVALHLSRNEGFGVVTRVASLYGKENSRDFLAEQMLRGNLLGYSKKEANPLLHRDGLQLPRRNPVVDLCTANIAQDTGVVNTHSMVVQIKMVEQSGNSDTSTTTDMVPQSDTAVNTHSMVNPTAFTVRCIWLTTEPKKLFAPKGIRPSALPNRLLPLKWGATAFLLIIYHNLIALSIPILW